mgnify:FL=1
MKRWVKTFFSLLLLIFILTGCAYKDGDVYKIPEPKEYKSQAQKNIDNLYGVYYQIYPRIFRDSDGDGIGDIQGIIDALDYLNDGNSNTDTDLGINGIWITPLTKSPSEHKYNTTNFCEIDAEYGTIEDYKELIEKSHKRGIKVIMDFAVNHVSCEHPWYKDALKNPKSIYRNYFRWINGDTDVYNIKASPWGRKVWVKKGGYYNYCLFEDTVPDLNFDNPKVREEIKKIAKFWIDTGVDGFRLDTANNIYGPDEYPKGTDRVGNNISWWMEFSNYVRGIKPEIMLIGEIWDKPDVIAPYLEPFDGAWNFTIQESLPNILNSGFDGGGFTSKLEKQYKEYDSVTKDYMDLPFLTNHDQDRIMGRLRDDVVKAKLAANIYMTLPGAPFIYAGEEIGMTTGNMRTPIKWFDEYKAPQTKCDTIKNSEKIVPLERQKDDPKSLYNHYKTVIRVRQGNEALMKGDFKAIDTGTNKVIGYMRSINKDNEAASKVIVLHNINFEEQIIEVKDIDISGVSVYYETEGLGQNTIINNKIKLKPQSTLILEIK